MTSPRKCYHAAQSRPVLTTFRARGHAPRPEWRARLEFRSTRIDRVDEERYRIHGDLTIRGVTRTVTLDTELGGIKADPWGSRRAGFSARTKIDRRDFGLTWNQALEAGGLLVGEKVDIELELEAVRPVQQATTSPA